MMRAVATEGAADAAAMSMALVVQARMSSKRLPGKVLRPIAGKPMLGWLLERLSRVAEVDRIVVATSTSPEDARICEYAESMNVPCFRGALDDVLGRLLGVCDRYALDALVRVNGDSPLLDPELVAQGVRLFIETGADLATNVFPRSFPAGQSVEVVTRAALERAARSATAHEKEHVTAHFYAHPEHYRIVNFTASTPSSDVQMAVDTRTDFDLTEQMILAMSSPESNYGVEALLALKSALAPPLAARETP